MPISERVIFDAALEIADPKARLAFVEKACEGDAELQARFPEIRAFSGKGLTDKYATLKLSISPQGIQAMIFRTETDNEFIEPYSKDHTIYAVFKSQREKGKLPWSCSTEDKKMAAEMMYSQFLRDGDT